MNRDLQWMPDQASNFAGEVDALYLFLVGVSAVFSIGIAALIIYFAVKYRTGSFADRSQGESHFFLMELSWIVLPTLLTMVMFFWGAKIYFRQSRPPVNAMEINCVGRQWMWKFQHPEGNSEIDDLHVPLGQAVKVNMISEDVIHSFYVPAFRVKQDVLPHRYTTIWFQPTRIGEYHLFCAEYCGAKHAQMRGTVHVMDPAEYQNWLSETGGDRSAREAGASLFAELRCDTCHRRDGTPGRGPALDGIFGSTVALQSGGTVTADESYLRESILRPTAKIVAGYQPLMPSFEGQISEEGILELIAEIKSWSQAAPDRRPNSQPQEGAAE